MIRYRECRRRYSNFFTVTCGTTGAVFFSVLPDQVGAAEAVSLHKVDKCCLAGRARTGPVTLGYNLRARTRLATTGASARRPSRSLRNREPIPRPDLPTSGPKTDASVPGCGSEGTAFATQHQSPARRQLQVRGVVNRQLMCGGQLGQPRERERRHLVIDSDAQSAEPAEAHLPFVFGELSSTNEDDEGVGHLKWPQRGHFERGGVSDGVLSSRRCCRGRGADLGGSCEAGVTYRAFATFGDRGKEDTSWPQQRTR